MRHSTIRIHPSIVPEQKSLSMKWPIVIMARHKSLLEEADIICTHCVWWNMLHEWMNESIDRSIQRRRKHDATTTTSFGWMDSWYLCMMWRHNCNRNHHFHRCMGRTTNPFMPIQLKSAPSVSTPNLFKPNEWVNEWIIVQFCFLPEPIRASCRGTRKQSIHPWIDPSIHWSIPLN